MGGENCDRATAKVGTHGFTAGKCSPSETGTPGTWQTFSVGIFQWVAGGKAPRKSAAQVRVSGSVGNPEAVYAKARAIAAELDAGTYSGPTRVSL